MMITCQQLATITIISIFKIFIDLQFSNFNFRTDTPISGTIKMEIENRVVILQDLRIQSFDTIRFASYRTACKLRYVQKACNCKLICHESRMSFP